MTIAHKIRPFLRLLGITDMTVKFNDDKTVTACYTYGGYRRSKIIDLADIEAEFAGSADNPADVPAGRDSQTSPP